MNVLLVDDDDYIIQALRRKLPWEELGIHQVYAVNNIRQAKELLEGISIQIMICDIEMPQGNGLELLSWIREKGYKLQAIFLTSYAQFDYVRKAIELKSLNYYLKPIDYEKLTLGIREAVAKEKELMEAEICRQESEYWKQNRDEIQRRFFHTFFLERQMEDEELLSIGRKAGFSYEADTGFLPFYLEFYDDKGVLEKWDPMRLVLTLEKIAAAAARKLEIRKAWAIHLRQTIFVILLELEEKDVPFLTVQTCAESMGKELRGKFDMNLFLEIGCVSTLLGLANALEDLERVRGDYVLREYEIVSVMEYENLNVTYHLPAITTWEALLCNCKTEEFLEKVSEYLEDLVEKKQLNREVLKWFRLDMMQLIYNCLKCTEVQAHKIFTNGTFELLYQKSLDSVQDMMNYVRYLAVNTMEYTNLAKAPSVVEKVKEYIDGNFGQEIARNDIAEQVYLNPDYLSRLFKKETGMSIGAYLLKKRIDTAKELLEQTSMPVNVISMYVGYNNYPYFTRVFHENTSYSPNEYRKKKKREEKERKGK